MDLPDRFYVFVNEQIPAVAHNMQFTRQLSSAAAGGWSDPDFVQRYIANEVDWLPFLPNPTATPWISFFGVSLTASFRVEYNAEVERRLQHPDKPSRLSAVYAFGSLEDAEQASSLYGWQPTMLREFELLEHPLTRIARCNMEIVSLARFAARISETNPDDETKLWDAYWAGQGDVVMELPTARLGEREERHSGIMWEYLIDGMLRLT